MTQQHTPGPWSYHETYPKGEPQSVLVTGQLRYMAAQCRPLPIALAHWCVREKPGSWKWPIVNRLYGGLSHQGQFSFQVELQECRAARRGERLAQTA